MRDETNTTRDAETMKWEARQARALDAVAPELGPVIRAARKAEGLGVRELARRAGIAESQISRLENGKTLSPSDETSAGIAAALGRPHLALTALTDNSEGMVLRDSAAEVLDTLPGWIQARHDLEQLEDATTLEELRPFARDVFIHQNLRSMVEAAGLSPGGDMFFQEIIDLWVGLTEERRAICRQAIRDQSRLSELDRKAAKGKRT